MPNVHVNVQSFKTLFDSAYYPLDLDTYQRPYVWDEDKVKQLINDLNDYITGKNPSNSYYMGAILLHKNDEKEKLYIIDGQQRLTALSILYSQLTQSLPKNNSLSYHSPISVKNIKQTQRHISQYLPDTITDNIFDRICFSVIMVDSEDLAFTFFDTQNNRGVTLSATDLLKAYHLRAIDSSNEQLSHDLQKYCAQQWEKLQKIPMRIQETKEKSDFVKVLFEKYLWRARVWTGQKNLSYETYNGVLDEFQIRTLEVESAADTVPLYRSKHNRQSQNITLSPSIGSFSVNEEKTLNIDRPHKIPFVIRQPISKGVGFFLYADKYMTLLDKLLNIGSKNNDIQDFNHFYDKVIAHLSPYLRELFLLSTLMYVDQFGSKKLYPFALWLDYALGALRVEKDNVYKASIPPFLRDKALNLLDVIANAFTPEQVINHLKDDASTQKIYTNDNIDMSKNGVKQDYKKRILNYYGLEDNLEVSLNNKAQWIENHLKGHQ